jgi:hypothetical protein
MPTWTPAADHNGGMGRWQVGTMALLGALVLTGCAGSHPQPDHQVLVFSTGDGTATISVGTPGDDEAALVAVAGALELGNIETIAPSSPDLRLDGATATLVDVDRSSVRVRMPDIRSALTANGAPADAPVFVSVCTSARTGRSAGADIELAHLDSCATWASDRARDPARAEAVITFEDRASPARASAVFLALLALVGLSLAVLSFTARSPRRGGFAYLGTWLLVFVSAGVSAVGWMFAYRLDRPWAETGQVFDRELAGSARALALTALLAGVLLPTVVALAGRRVTRRRWRG